MDFEKAVSFVRTVADLRRIAITQEHRILEAKLRRFPKTGNERHTRAEVSAARRGIQQAGLLFCIRQEDGKDYDVIPDELAGEPRAALRIELRTDAYRELFKFHKVRTQAHLADVLERENVPFLKRTRSTASSPTYRPAKPSAAPPRLRPQRRRAQRLVPRPRPLRHHRRKGPAHRPTLCRPAPARGAPRRPALPLVRRLRRLRHAQPRPAPRPAPHRERHRDRGQIEHATQFLFQTKLGHTPLKQPGTDHPDGLLSLESDYLMWGNKSKNAPGLFHLKDCIGQFDCYMNAADKRVPIFLVIAPAFTEDREVEAIRYHAEHFDRNIVLITATDLKALAEEWSAPTHKNRETPFPLGLLSASGRYDRRRPGKLAN